MDIKILNRYTNQQIYQGDHGSLQEALVFAAKHDISLSQAFLSSLDIFIGKNQICIKDADLSGLRLNDSLLDYAFFTKCNLQEADFHRANLQGATFSNSNLSRVNFYRADLTGCSFENVDLTGAIFTYAILENIYFHNVKLDTHAILEHVYFHNVKLDPSFAAKLSICPAGNIIVWKKLREGVCKLLIPEDAARSNGISRHCRASHAIVLELPEGCQEGHSFYDEHFIYRVGDTVYPRDPFNYDRWKKCASGIHFFVTREEAEEYVY